MGLLSFNSENIIEEYIVKETDTLVDIASKLDLPILELRLINGLYNNDIYVGQRLKVYPKKTYIVKPNDSLFSIGKKFGVAEDKLKHINNIDEGKLYEGKRLVISDPIVKYTVKQHDDIEKIAQTFKILVEELIEYNGINDYQIFTGQELYIKMPSTVNNPSFFHVLVNKSFTLPQYYVPEKLTVPNVSFPFEYFHEKKLMREDGARALECLFKKANEDGIDLYALSGYRSYSRQKFIFESGVKEEGFEITNRLSAKPGNSEHQTGLAMDVTCPQIKYSLDQSFENTKEGHWIKENAHKFGFILRYLKGKEHITGYQYEPWHIRYVGKETAISIKNLGLTFEEYLGIE